ncbi:MAG: alpha/beta hydrolase [Lachnospiraceae bacterium]|nr:alpha/beta hydrolase [Lachnospiraceae bacterium]
MADKTEYSFESTDDRHTKIHAVKWEDKDKDTVAVLQIAHGMQEHIERYAEFASFLADKGFVVFGHDHIGHGESVESVDELGIMHCDRPDDVMVEDMFSHHKMIKEQYPDKPYFILGHSMGSYLLRKFLCVKAKDLKGVNGAIVMGTGTESNAAITAGGLICRLLMAVKGRDSQSDMIKGLMFGNKYYKGFDTTGEHPENSWLSKNVESVKAYTDPENKKDGGTFSLNGYMILLRATLYDNDMKNIRMMDTDIPVIFVSGDKDPVGAFGEGVKKAYDKFRAAGIKDLSIKLYEGDRHEILNELDREIVYNDLYEWMLKRVSR